MRSAIVALLLCACATASEGKPAPDPPPPAAKPPRLPPDDLVATMIGRLGKAAGCPASHRVWCIAADGWNAAAAADLPAGDVVLIGVSVPLERARDDAELLETEVDLTALAIRDGKAIITDIPPANAAEKKAIADAIASVGRVLKGQDAKVTIAPTLARYLATLPETATYPMTREKTQWRFRGKADARLRKVGKSWVAVEIPGEGPEGIFVTVFVP
jgi:hypothetical protein